MWREHRNSTLNEVYARGAFPSFSIKGSVGLDYKMSVSSYTTGGGLTEVRDVRNVNSDFESPILHLLDVEGIIQILGSGRVDGEDTAVPQIFSYLALSLGNTARYFRSASTMYNSPPGQGR